MGFCIPEECLPYLLQLRALWFTANAQLPAVAGWPRAHRLVTGLLFFLQGRYIVLAPIHQLATWSNLLETEPPSPKTAPGKDESEFLMLPGFLSLALLLKRFTGVFLIHFYF